MDNDSIEVSFDGDALVALVEAAPIGMAVLDDAMRYIAVNATLASLHRVPIREHVGRRPSELLPQAGHVLELSGRRVLAGEAERAEIEFEVPTPALPGAPRQLRAWLFGLRARENRGPGPTGGSVRIGLTVVERPQLSETEALVARLRREAEEAVRVRDEVLSAASHELRTPLATLQLQLHDVLSDVSASSKSADVGSLQVRLESAERQVRRLVQLAGALLDVGRTAAGAVELEPVDLVEVVRTVLDRHAADATHAGCAVSLCAPSALVGRWHRGHLEQIVTNLFGNALKFGAGRPVEVEIRSDGTTAVLVVRDQGIGIAPEEQELIFQRFGRASSSQKHPGSGLGLWIVRRLVEGLGGTISVASRPREGAVFTVTLPRQGAANEIATERLEPHSGGTLASLGAIEHARSE